MFNGSYQSGYGYMQPQTVVQVSGIDSARQIRLPPNSSMFALDYDQKHVYAVYTDGAGVATAVPYTLTPCEEAGRYVTLEQFNELKERINGYLSERREQAEPGAAHAVHQPDKPAGR